MSVKLDSIPGRWQIWTSVNGTSEGYVAMFGTNGTCSAVGGPDPLDNVETFSGTWKLFPGPLPELVVAVTDSSTGAHTPFYLSGFLVGGAMGGPISQDEPQPPAPPSQFIGGWSAQKLSDSSLQTQ